MSVPLPLFNLNEKSGIDTIPLVMLNDEMVNTYHITAGSYGTRLHGGDAPSVALPNNRLGDSFVPFDPELWHWRRELMVQEPTYFTDEQRLFLEREIAAVCEKGDWILHIFACQSDHFHLLLSADAEPKTLRRWLKRWLTETLNERFGKKRWFADGGSTKWVNDDDYFKAVFAYIQRQRFTPQ